MRGSFKTQITTALKACTKIGLSRHEQKKLCDGKSPYIHSLGSFDKIAHRLWPLQDWLRKKNIVNIELLTDDLVADYLRTRLAYHKRHGNSRKTYQAEVSALGNLERGLNYFSAEHRNPPLCYDFSLARKKAAKQANILPKTTAQYTTRALPKPFDLIAALEQPHHRLMALLQLYCGCRAEGVGAPRRQTLDGNRLTLKNFEDGDGERIPEQIDPVTGIKVQPFWTKEKGGKVAVKFCPLCVAEEVLQWLEHHPEGLGDKYETYLAAVNSAMYKTGQYSKGRGTHSLRFTFAQKRYLACIVTIAHDCRQCLAPSCCSSKNESFCLSVILSAFGAVALALSL